MKLLQSVLIYLAAFCNLGYADVSAESAGEFWAWFEKHESELAKLFSYETGAKAENDPKLQKKIEDTVGLVGERVRNVHPSFSPFFGYADEQNSMTITVHGEAEFFEDVDRFIELAPKQVGWKLIALKQPRVFAPEMEIQTGNTRLKVGDWNYSKTKSKDGKFNFVIYVPNKVSDDPEGFNALFMQLMQDSLGERLANTAVESIKVAQNPSPLPPGLIPFSQIVPDINKALKKG